MIHYWWNSLTLHIPNDNQEKWSICSSSCCSLAGSWSSERWNKIEFWRSECRSRNDRGRYNRRCLWSQGCWGGCNPRSTQVIGGHFAAKEHECHTKFLEMQWMKGESDKRNRRTHTSGECRLYSGNAHWLWSLSSIAPGVVAAMVDSLTIGTNGSIVIGRGDVMLPRR